jgi:hypothetical protein
MDISIIILKVNKMFKGFDDDEDDEYVPRGTFT